MERRDDAPIPKMEREMSGRTLDDFLEDAEAFDALSEEDKARLMSGETLEGETEAAKAAAEPSTQQQVEASAKEAEKGSEPPAAASADPKEPPAASAEPVVLAKDGQHTIPYSELEAARERARQLEQELAALKSKPADPPAAAVEPAAAQPSLDEKLASLVEERDNALFSGDTDTAKRISLQIIGIQNDIATKAAIAAMEAKESERQAKDSADSAMAAAQEKAGALVKQYPFLDPNSPQVNQDAIDLVVAQRDKLMASGIAFADAIEKAVAKVAPLFVKETPAQQPVADVAAKAAEAIAKAKSVVPTSLSQVPGGSAAHHDEAEAIRSMDGLSLLGKFDGKSSEDILKLMSRVI